LVKQAIEKLKNKVNDKVNKINNKINDIIFNSQSDLGKVMKQLNKKIYSDKINYSIDNHINAIYVFYYDKLNNFCKEKELDVISQLMWHKKELENDKNYYFTIFIGIATGIISSIIINIINFTMKFDFSTLEGTVINFFIYMALIIIDFLIIIWIRCTLNSLRTNEYNKECYLKDFELKMINNIINKLQQKSLDVDVNSNGQSGHAQTSFTPQ
jgi:hypothetical protein